MRLTWRDGVTTVLAAFVVLVTVAHLQTWSVAIVEDARGATLAIGIIGLGMCIVGGSSAVITAKSGYTVLAGALGGTAMLLIIAGLITGWSELVTVLAADIVLLYAGATVRHALGGTLAPTPA